MLVADILSENNFKNFAFLDSTIPQINKLLKIGITNFFARISSLEPYLYAERMSKLIGCGSTRLRLPITPKELKNLKITII